MIHIIVGTAGHIDHGKTALVRALTGIDTDRLKEEKARGISIDLGFAHLDLGNGASAGFVDVPGHERFVKNMLAGATGIDLVLFVVAADEGIKPQTREHFDICRLLGIPRGIIVLTKTDVAGDALLEIVRLEVEDFVAGSFLEGAPIHAVSSATGEGIADLKDEVARQTQKIGRRDESRYFRMPIDRAFTMRGFGPVVTGTIHSGGVAVEDELELFPTARRVRVRGIQTHGAKSPRAVAGQRTALNLAGVDLADLSRGMTLAPPGLFRTTKELGCRLELLASAPLLKHRTPVHFHVGTAEVEAEIRLLDAEEAAPGTSPLARIVLAEPLLALPGDRFILRRFSPVETIGGGVVLDCAPPSIRRASLAGWLSKLENSSAKARVAALVSEFTHGCTRAELIARGGFTEREIAEAELTAIGNWLITPEQFAGLRRSLVLATQSFHKTSPLAPGIPKEELRGQLAGAVPSQVLDAALKAATELATEGEFVRLASHRTKFGEDEDAALAKIEEAFQRAGLTVPPTEEVLARAGVDLARARSLLQILLRNGKLVRVTPDLVFHESAVQTLRGLLAGRRGEGFTVTDFKSWTGVSRKYAIPLLEYLDRTRITRRDGDRRVIL